ncbi:1-deoxy-D-xylulose-5-phosphate reductoisomerase [bacterium]|nr:1-deoxy-D-xylulose-5-phosphate reductoisomerase [bacterium]
MQHLIIVGSTGSIGNSTLDIVRQHPHLFCVAALAAGRNSDLLIKQAREFRPHLVHIAAPDRYQQVRDALVSEGIEVLSGQEELQQLPSRSKGGTLVNAIVGNRGLAVVVNAIEAGKRICLANKEPLVSAGRLVRKLLERHQVQLLPIDSEHSAILQCIQGEDPRQIRRIILTASGGTFRGRRSLSGITPAEALNHPNWSMGNKITIDSATLMNKGLELIEAYWLYPVTADRIDIVIHPQSIVHSLVEFNDGSMKAQLGLPDMRIPIQYALTFPEHLDLKMDRLDLAAIGTLTFEEPDEQLFPSLRIAREALQRGGTYPAALNAANEAAVELFLKGQIEFTGIFQLIEETLANHTSIENYTLEDIFALDEEIHSQLVAS